MAINTYSLYNTRPADSGANISRGVAATGTNTYYSDKFDPLGEGFGLHVETTGTLTGTWTLWKSDRAFPDPANDNDWVDISTHADFTKTNPAGAATKWAVNSTALRARYFRLKYVNTSGTGTLLADATPAY